MDELFESLTLIQTHRMDRFPVVLYGSDYWNGLIDWLKKALVKNGYIDEADLDLFRVVDKPEDVILKIKNFYKMKLNGKKS